MHKEILSAETNTSERAVQFGTVPLPSRAVCQLSVKSVEWLLRLFVVIQKSRCGERMQSLALP